MVDWLVAYLVALVIHQVASCRMAPASHAVSERDIGSNKPLR